MNGDIFGAWKMGKFIVADYKLLNEPEIIVVLTDIDYWVKNIDSLEEWCQINGGQVKGMTVGFDSSEELSLFLLRWT